MTTNSVEKIDLRRLHIFFVLHGLHIRQCQALNMRHFPSSSKGLGFGLRVEIGCYGGWDAYLRRVSHDCGESPKW